VIFLDSYAVLALALDERAAEEVEELIRQNDTAITSVNLFEVVDYCVRRARLAELDARAELSLVFGESIRIVPVTEEHAWRGALLRARHYSRGSCEVSLADCVLLAAPGEGDSVATADPSIVAVAGAEMIDAIVLPATS
jgi:PIN domain nuclease of toxin-antitoxin system